MSESSRLLRDVRSCVEGVRLGPAERAAQPVCIAQVGCRDGVIDSDQIRVETDDVGQLEIDRVDLSRLAQQALRGASGACGSGGRMPRTIVFLKDRERLAIVVDHAPTNLPDPIAGVAGQDHAQLARRGLIEDDELSGGKAVRLKIPRDRNDVAVPDTPDLHDLHETQCIRGYTGSQ